MAKAFWAGGGAKVLMALAAPPPAAAGMIQYYGPTDAAVTGGTLAAAATYATGGSEVKLRPQQGNWNMALNNGNGTSGTGATANFVGTVLSPAPNSGTSIPYFFTETYIPNAGFVFALQAAQILAGVPSVVAANLTYVQCWGGNFGVACPTGAGYSTKIVNTLNGLSPGGSFNAIQIAARSNSANDANATNWWNLSVDVPGFTQQNLNQFAASGSVTSATSAVAGGFATQWVVSDTDLSQVAWSISGFVRLQPASNSENFKFTIGTATVPSSFVAAAASAVDIPEPASLLLLGGGLVGLALRRRARA